jgi:photosystem II stability/assembly factor-like uncharacterized protein
MNSRYLTLIYLLTVFSSFILSQNSWDLQTTGITNTLNCIRVVNNNIAWAAGDSGKVIRTVNSGMTWTSVDDGNFGDAIIWNIDALDSSTAFVTITPLPLSTTYIYRTINGGNSWELVFSQDGGFINDIHMINQMNGLAYGDPVDNKWTIIKTTDGGTSWSRISTEPSPNGSEVGFYYNSLYMIGSTDIWFLGTQRVYRSSDGGATWTNSLTPDYYLSVWFINDSVGMCSSNSNAGLSTNSGINWNQITVPGSGSYYSLAGSGTRDFWTASDGYVYHTTDFGSNWSSELIFFGNIFAMDFVTIGSNAIGYVAGTNGTIARYEGAITSISKQPSISNKYSLEQNYPNPFNPTTKIKFTIPNAQFVTVKIFDVLGKFVMSICNEEKPSGTYELNFDGIGLSSGIYFYQLQAGNFIETKKFTLIK